MIDRHSLKSLVLCTAGMFAGLIVDDGQGRLATLTALCSAGDRRLLDAIRLHWSELPAMHTGMIVGALFALLFGPVRATLCYGLMLAGMEVGLLVTQHVTDRGGSPSIMVCGMTAGMISGMFMGCIKSTQTLH